MATQQKSTLYGISNWNDDETWKYWNFRDVPLALQPQALLFINELKGAAPIHRRK
jgi:hypothetical protein